MIKYSKLYKYVQDYQIMFESDVNLLSIGAKREFETNHMKISAKTLASSNFLKYDNLYFKNFNKLINRFFGFYYK